MIRTSRLFLALGLVLALGVSGIAFADGASENTSEVIGKVKPKKLDKKKFKKAKLFTQVSTDFGSTPLGTQQNAEEVYIDFGKNLKFKTKAAPRCSASLAGTTTATAIDRCGNAKVSKSGSATARVPGFPAPNNEVTDITVTAFNGPGRNQLRLHAYSPTLGPGLTQVVDGSIVKSPAGKKYRKRLSVPDAPDLAGDNAGLTSFGATIKKGKYISARCKAKKFHWRAEWVYDDGSRDTDKFSQKCKRKKRR